MNATHSITVTALAGLIVPFAQRRLGITLTADDVAALVAVCLGVYHAISAAFMRWGAPFLDRLAAGRAVPSTQIQTGVNP